jgi:aldose sugar dehydrogenase
MADIYKCEEEAGLISPSIVWQNAITTWWRCNLYRKCHPEWKGNLIIGTLGSQHLHRVVIENG